MNAFRRAIGVAGSVALLLTGCATCREHPRVCSFIATSAVLCVVAWHKSGGEPRPDAPQASLPKCDKGECK